MPLIQHSKFFAPPVLKIIDAINKGQLKSLPDNFSLKAQWSPGFQAKLWEFLTKGDLTFLPELLSVNPMAISHPVIYWEIRHLGKMVRFMDSEEAEKEKLLEGWVPDDSETILSPSDKATAKGLLESILGTAVSHILPGYMVTKRPKAKRPGRKPKHDESFLFDLFFDFQTHCESLAKVFHNHTQTITRKNKDFWKPRPGESQKKFGARIGDILNELNDNSRHSRLMIYPSIFRLRKSSAHSPTQAGMGKELSKRELTKLFQQKATVKYFPLPPKAIPDMIKYASRSNSTVDPRRLLYAFLAHWYHQTPDTIRGIIVPYESDNPREAVKLNDLLYGPRF